LSFGQFGGFFVDSCVLLPHSLESMTKTCSAFLKENEERCILCSTVKDEALNLIERSYSIIISDFRSKLKPFLEEQGIKQITNRNGRIISRFFSERKKSLRVKAPHRTNVRNEIIGTIENYVASRLHSLKDGSKMSLDNFLAAMMTELVTIKYNLQAPFKCMKTVDIIADDSIVSLIILGTLLMNRLDAEHLASVLQYQFQQNKWVIFVTYDEKDILSKENSIYEIFALQCSKPEWALDHYRYLTRLKSPIEHFRELPNYSVKQKEFGKTIEKVMGIRILG
jgi:hypothetical protein